MDSSLTIAFWGVSMLFVLTPGVDWAYAISSGIRRRGAFPAVSGMLTGHLAATVIVAAGVAAILAASETAMTVLTITGAAYLIWLGGAVVRHPATRDLERLQAPTSRRRLFAKGVGISLLNPKVFLLFLALLPQFISPDAPWPIAVQMIALGTLHVLNCALVYFPVAYGASALLTTRPRAARIIGISSGIIMIGLGLALVIERALPLLL